MGTGRGRSTMDFKEEALKLHSSHQGKIGVCSKVAVETREDLSTAYTPGVAEPCKEIAKDPQAVWKYTAKGRLVAVVSDGSAVLGLGNIGPLAAMPVMEGKAILFKEFGDVDAFPVCLDTQDPREIIETVKRIAPCFGGINLEDIASPQCFAIEEALERELDIPVFHDDQHGTAIVVTAALFNALKITKKKIQDIKVVLNGPGSAGTAIIKMLLESGAGHIIACDEYGILYSEREKGIADHKKWLCQVTNPEHLKGGLEEALAGADVFIGVSVAHALTPEMIQSMGRDPIVFAMANPEPEISYDGALAAGAAVAGTGRSDRPNQINNVLAFPGIFKGALRAGARNITVEMKKAAARAIAEYIPRDSLTPEYIIPSVLDKNVAEAVAKAVEAAAVHRGAPGQKEEK
mgnify:CR=1 FL=1